MAWPRDPQRYQILGEHGRGGLGRVSRARDLELGRDIAIKELISRGTVSELRFLREALITARLEHPGIVPVYEAGRWSDGTPFYAMKLVAGRPLRDLIAECTTVDQRIGLLHHVIAVADAIAYAHGKNIIHRDLKPANVIVGEFGETVVIDWGLAKNVAASDESSAGDSLPRSASNEGLTSIGAILGTPAYMAPEQSRGEHVDQRADVYAIGMMLWELCSPNKLPTDSAALRRRILRRAGIDQDLVAIINKACDPAPERRYPHAGALAVDLKAFKAGARITGRNYSLLGMLGHWTRRHRMLAGSVTAAICLTAAASVVHVHTLATERDRADEAVDRLALSNANLGRERATAIEQRNALILAQASAALESDPTRAIEWLKTYPADGADGDLVQVIAADAQSRGIARHIIPAMSETLAISADGKTLLTAGPHRIAQLWNLATGELIRSVTARGQIRAGKISPDGSTIALGDSTGDVVLWNPASDSRTKLATLDSGALYVAFSPDGKALASSSLHAAVVWDLTTHRQTRSLPAARTITVLAMSPIDQTLAFGTDDGTLQLWDLAHGRGRQLAGHIGAMNVIAFSPDGRQLATTGRDHSVRLWDVTSGQSRVLGWHDSQARDVAFSPADPTLVASGGADQKVRLWSTTGGPSRVFSGHTDMVNAVVFSPDGKTLASAALNRQVRLWDVASGEARVFSGHRGDLGNVVFSPDGALFVSSGYDEGTRIWQFTPPPSRILGRHEFEVLQAVFSPDGRFVASSGADRTARLWNLATGAEQPLSGIEPTGKAFAAGVMFSASGEWLASIGDNAAHLWHLPTGEARAFVAADTLLRRVAITTDAARIAAGGSDGNVRLWDVASHRLTLLTGHTGEIATLAFLPSGDRLISGASDGTLRIWDLSAAPIRSELLGAHQVPQSRLAISPAGDLVASASADGVIELWNLPAKTHRTLTGHTRGLGDLKFSRDGRLLASASEDKTARIWDVATGQSRVLRGHDEPLRAIGFASNGTLVATGGNDQTVRLWNLTTGAITVLRGHHGPVLSVAFDATGQQLVSTSDDGTVRLWDVAHAVAVPHDRAELSAWLAAQTTSKSLPTAAKTP